jgi:P-type conjugative transfer protein TrbJ
MRRLLTTTTLVLSLSVPSVSGPAGATGIPVFDAAGFSQSLITATNAVTQVANQARQIQNQISMIRNQVQSLQTLGSARFGALAGNLVIQAAQVQALLNQVQGIGYSLNGIDRQFGALFPGDLDWAELPIEQHQDYYIRWSDQLHEASRTAMAGQGVIRNIQTHNAEARQILMQAHGADGEVRQLQAVNEMLSVLASQLGDVTMTMSATGRVTASAAAATRAERDAQRALMRRFTAPVMIPVDDGRRF